MCDFLLFSPIPHFFGYVGFSRTRGEVGDLMPESKPPAPELPPINFRLSGCQATISKFPPPPIVMLYPH